MENGHITDKTFCTFVNPGKPTPARVVELTGINDAMVADARAGGGHPPVQGVLRGIRLLVAHNANGFDMLFIRKAGEKAASALTTPTSTHCRWRRHSILDLRNYKLDTIGKYLEIPPFQHHRACDDAKRRWRRST